MFKAGLGAHARRRARARRGAADSQTAPAATQGRPRGAWWVERLEARTLLSFSPVGPEFNVNTVTVGSQTAPALASDADGDSVVVWVSAGQDGSGDGVYAQRYNAAGVAQGEEFRVNSFTAGTQSAPAV